MTVSGGGENKHSDNCMHAGSSPKYEQVQSSISEIRVYSSDGKQVGITYQYE